MDLSNLYIPKAPDLITPLKQVVDMQQEQQRIGLSREQIGIARENQAINKSQLGIQQAEEDRKQKTYELMEKRNHTPVYVDDIESPNPSSEYKALTGGSMSLGKEGSNVKSKVMQYATDMGIVKKNPITGREYVEFADHEMIKKMLNEDLDMSKGLTQAKRADLIDAITQIDLILQNPEKKLKPEEQKMLLQQQSEMKTQLNAADAKLMGFGVDVNNQGQAGTPSDTAEYARLINSPNPADQAKAKRMIEFRRAQEPEVYGTTSARERAITEYAQPKAYETKTGTGKAEFELAMPKVSNALSALNKQWDLVDSTIDDAIKSVTPFTSGVGSWLSSVPATPQKNLAAKLDMIRANIGFDKLQQMRADSPTGGALGQVSDFENRLLQAVKGSLDQAQSPAQLIENLKQVKRDLADIKRDRNAAFKQDYGGLTKESSTKGVKLSPTDEANEYLRKKGLK